MNIIYRIFKDYSFFYQNIQSFLNESGVILLMIDPKKLTIINNTKLKDFEKSLIDSIPFKESIQNMLASISKTNKIVQSCIKIDKKYYNLSLYCIYKKIFFTHKKKYLICLVNDITLQVNAHQATYDAYHEQLRINKMKTSFLSRMSHEFRTPLNAVIGFSDAIKHKLYGDIQKPYLEYINNIHAAGNHLLDIVNDILDVSYFENNDIQLKPSLFSPINALDNILHFIHSLLTKQKIIVKLSHNLPNNFMMFNDLNVFKRILINIIGNTTKYCPENTLLEIVISNTEQFLVIYMRDYGVGFPQTVIDNFGVPFNVGDNFLTDNNQSIGLGLSIIKSAIQTMNGFVEIYNHPQGGAVIHLHIPNNVKETELNIVSNNSFFKFIKKAS